MIPDSLPEILVVDDQPNNLNVLNQILSPYYEVRLTINGALAVSAAQASPPDLILLDIMLPDFNGFEVCARLKADERTRSIPVIFISALDARLDKQNAFQAGGIDFIVKPFEVEEVLARVKHHISYHRIQNELVRKAAALEEQRSGYQQSLLAQELMHEILVTAIDQADLMALLPGWVSRFGQVLGAYACWLVLADEQTGEVLLTTAYGVDQQPAGQHFAPGSLEQALTRAVLAEGLTLAIENLPQSAYAALQMPALFSAQAVLCLPLLACEKKFGVLTACYPAPKAFEPALIRLGEQIAQEIALALHNAGQVRHMAEIDALTGLYNRRFFSAQAERDLRRAVRYHTSLALVLLDVDHFKQMRDLYGAGIGNNLLQQMAHLCTSCVRSTDLVGRYGNDELVLLLIEIDPLSARQLAERLCTLIANHDFELGPDPIKVTVSMGIGLFNEPPECALSLDDLFHDAEVALNQSKTSGRNQVTVFEAPDRGSSQTVDPAQHAVQPLLPPTHPDETA